MCKEILDRHIRICYIGIPRDAWKKEHEGEKRKWQPLKQLKTSIFTQ